jgi:hypothetical protein
LLRALPYFNTKPTFALAHLRTQAVRGSVYLNAETAFALPQLRPRCGKLSPDFLTELRNLQLDGRDPSWQFRETSHF